MNNLYLQSSTVQGGGKNTPAKYIYYVNGFCSSRALICFVDNLVTFVSLDSCLVLLKLMTRIFD